MVSREKKESLETCEDRIRLDLQQRGDEHKILIGTVKEQSQLLTEQNKVLDKVEENTRNIVVVLEEFRKDQKEMVGLIAGKKQVPLSVFTIITFSLVVLLVLTWADNRWSNVEINTNGIKISEKEKEVAERLRKLELEESAAHGRPVPPPLKELPELAPVPPDRHSMLENIINYAFADEDKNHEEKTRSNISISD